MVSRRWNLSEHPVSALSELANAGWIAQPVYVGGEGLDGYAMVVEVEDWGHEVALAETKTLAKRMAAEAMLTRLMAKLCPTPTKVRHATWEAGYNSLIRLQTTGRIPVRQVYSCRCGWWHLSSRDY